MEARSQVFDVRRIDKAGRLGLPHALRALLGWRSGDVIGIGLSGGHVVLERRTGEAEEPAPEDGASPA